MEQQQNKTKRKLKGTVISNKMDKTAVVRVDRVRRHSVYEKPYTVSKTYKAHDEKNQAKIGDIVEIVECRPYSKDKTWRISS